MSGRPKGWATLIGQIDDIDPDTTYDTLARALRQPHSDRLTASALNKSLAECQSNFVQAGMLKDKARSEYELYKVAYDEWIEPKRTAARISLEEEKKDKELKKQITEKMVEDRIVATWGEEFRTRKKNLLDFQAATHTLETFVEAWKQRARSLEAMVPLVLALGDSSSPRRRED